MEILALLLVCVALFIIIGACCGIIAWFRIGALRDELNDAKRTIATITKTLRARPIAPEATEQRSPPTATTPSLRSVAIPEPAPAAIPTPVTALPPSLSVLSVPTEPTATATPNAASSPARTADLAPAATEQTTAKPDAMVKTNVAYCAQKFVESLTQATKEQAQSPAPAEPALASPAPQTQIQAPLQTPAALSQASASSPNPAPQTDSSSDNAISFESLVGKRWLTWGGVGLFFLGIAFLLRYAYTEGLLANILPPPVRIGGIMLAGIGAVWWGLRAVRAGLGSWGHGIIAGGLGLGYLAAFAAFRPLPGLTDERLVAQEVAFAVMACITAAGTIIAVRLHALPLAIGALVGGLLTPLLLSDGSGNRDALFTYLLLLDLGVVGAAFLRSWRALDVLAFAGTALLYVGFHLSAKEAPSTDIPLGMLLWLGVFHLLFLCISCAMHFRLRTAMLPERFAMAVGNIAFGLGYAAVLLHQQETTLVLAIISLVGAAGYAAIGVAMAVRCRDQVTLHGFLALAVMLLSLGLYLMLPVEAIATAWLVEAVALMWLGYRYAYRPTRVLAVVVLALGLVRIVVVSAPHPVFSAPLLMNDWFFAMILSAPVTAAMAWLMLRSAVGVRERRVGLEIAWVAGGIVLLSVSAELLRHAQGHPELWLEVPASAVVALWLMCGALAYAFCAHRAGAATRTVSAVIAGAASLAALIGCIEAPHAGWPMLSWSGLLLMATLAGWLALAWLWRRSGERALGWLGESACIALTTITVSCELACWASVHAWSLSASATLLGTWWALAAGAFAWWSVRSGIIAHGVALLLAAAAGIAAVVADCAATRIPDHPPCWSPAAIAFAGALAAVWLVGWLLRLRPTAYSSIVAVVCDVLLAVTAFVWITCDLGLWIALHDLSLPGAASTLAWGWLGVGALLFAHRCVQASTVTGIASGLSLACALLVSLLAYAEAWTAGWPMLNPRLLAAACAMAAACLWLRVVLSPLQVPALLRSNIGWGLCLFGFLAITCEAWHACVDRLPQAEGLAQMMVSLSWVLIAAGGLTWGFWRKQRTVRFCALGVFGLVAAKLLIVDLQDASQVWRIIAFMVAGVVLLAASYAYHRLEKHFGR